LDVRSLVPVGADPHTFEARPSDVIALATADIVLDNGLGLTPWLSPLSAHIEGDLVVLTEDLTAGERSPGGVPDPHVWMVPLYVRDAYVPAIAEAFARRDPDGAAVYEALAGRYQERLTALEEDLRLQLAGIPDSNRVIATTHDGYNRFARHFGFGEPITLVGISTEEQPSAMRMAAAIDRVRGSGVPAVFRESTVNNSLIAQVAREAGLPLGGPLYGDSVGGERTGAMTYEDMMRANAAALVEALGAPE